MATQRDSKIVGTFGNTIFYNRLGQYCMRIKPADVRRTAASVHSGINFGKASRIAKQIRQLVSLIYSLKSDSFLINRLNGEMNKFINWYEKITGAFKTLPPKLPFIYRFQINDAADLSSIKSIEPIVKSTSPGFLELSFTPLIPRQSMHAPSNAVSISLKMLLISVNMNDPQTILLEKLEIEMPYTMESFQIPSINAVVNDQTGNLAMLLVSIQYMINRNGDSEILADRKKLPCGIAWAGII